MSELERSAKMLERFLRLITRPIARRKVDDRVVDDFAGIFESNFELRGLKTIATRPLLNRLTEEAYFRAAVGESDGVPRCGAMFEQVETLSDLVAKAVAGEAVTDPGIVAILNFHGIEIRTAQRPQ